VVHGAWPDRPEIRDADPVAAGTSGTRYFGTSEVQTIFQHTAQVTAISSAGNGGFTDSYGAQVTSSEAEDLVHYVRAMQQGHH